MCAATRFPEDFPVRKITTPVVVQALTKFFPLFGFPRVLQTNQGSNFMLKVFAQVLKQLKIQHCHSSAYHPESQGALERFQRNRDYLISTPDRRRATRLCHVNMVKPYFERVDSFVSESVNPIVVPEELSSDTGAERSQPRVTLCTDVPELSSSAPAEDDSLSVALTQGKFASSVALQNLPVLLSQLSDSEQVDFITLIQFILCSVKVVSCK